MEMVAELVAERPVVIFSKSSCCLCHTIKTLFSSFGVHAAVHELDEIPGGWEIEQALSAVPAVFIGQNFVGGLAEVNSLHLQRKLLPMLKREGALWL